MPNRFSDRSHGPEDGADGPAELPAREAKALQALGLMAGDLPPGFAWAPDERAWTRTVALDPSGRQGLRPGEAQQLSVLCAGFNERVGAYALRLYVRDPSP